MALTTRGVISFKLALPFLTFELPIIVMELILRRERMVEKYYDSIADELNAEVGASGGLLAFLEGFSGSYQSRSDGSPESNTPTSLQELSNKGETISRKIRLNMSKWDSYDVTEKKKALGHHFNLYNGFYNSLLSLIHHLEATPLDRASLDGSLEDMIQDAKEYLHKIESVMKPIPGGDYAVAGLQQVKAWGWDSRILLNKLIDIDYATMDGLVPAMEGTADQWSTTFFDNPDTWRLIVDRPRHIIGYWHFVSLYDEYYSKAKQGKLDESEINQKSVKPIEDEGEYNIYFVSIGILQEHRENIHPKLLLWDSLYNSILEFAKNGVFVKEIVANAYTEEGLRLCEKRFGMEFVCEHTTKGKIYSRMLYPFRETDNFAAKYPEIITLYSKHFETFRSG